MDTTEEKEPTAAELQKEEIVVFLLHDQTIKTIDGNFKKLARCSWGKELQVMDALKEILADIANSGVLRPDALTEGEAMFALLSTVFGRCPQALTKIVAALVDESDEWVRNNLELDTMLGLVIPFLSGKSQQLGAVLSRYSAPLQGAAQRILNNS